MTNERIYALGDYYRGKESVDVSQKPWVSVRVREIRGLRLPREEARHQPKLKKSAVRYTRKKKRIKRTASNSLAY